MKDKIITSWRKLKQFLDDLDIFLWLFIISVIFFASIVFISCG